MAIPVLGHTVRAMPTAALRSTVVVLANPWRKFFALLLLCLVACAALAQDVLPIPALTARVMDQAATLTSAQRQALEDKLAAFERERGSQVVVAVVPTTAPEDIADYTQRLGDAWKIGRQGVGDGVLLVVAKSDRRLRIATMKAVEGAIPDLVAKRIIDQAITPHFKQGDYAAGLNAGVDAIMARLKGEDLPLPAAGATGDLARDDWTDTLALLGFGALFLNLILREMLGNKLGTVAAPLATGVLAAYLTSSVWMGIGVGLLALVVGILLAAMKWGAGAAGAGIHRGQHHGSDRHWGGGGWGGGSGGGFGGGGFSSGGGGDSGGGGASGGW